MRAWTFSSVMSGPFPSNSRASMPSQASMAGTIGTSSSCAPRSDAHSAASSRLSREVNTDGIITQRTFFAPSASTATAADKAESIPPERPKTTPGNRFFCT